MKFHNRTEELKELERIFSLCRNSSHMTVIIGRRRVGKSRLIEEYCKNKKSLSFFVEKKNIKIMLEEFSEKAKDHFGLGPTYIKLDEFLESLFEKSKEEPYVLFFDEFQNFNSVEPAAFSMLQKIYDNHKNNSKLHLILVGSYISLMKKIFLDNKEPLFGRSTENINLTPLEFAHVNIILSELKINSFNDKIEYYSFFGGIPKYYAVIEDQGLKGKKLEEVLGMLFLRRLAVLKNEAKEILIEDFGTDYKVYFSILEAVSLGINEMSRIADKTGINIKSISKYLQILVNDFEFLEYKIPITEQKAWKSKKGRYFIKDQLFNFWFRFIYRNISYYESDDYDKIKEIIHNQKNEYVSKYFEKICMELIKIKNKDYDKVGQWWSRKGLEMDICAINDKTNDILFGECKWQENIDPQKVLKDLKEKIKYADWNLNKRKERFVIFAKSFKTKTVEDATLYDLKDIEDFFNDYSKIDSKK